MVKNADFITALNHTITSSLWLVWVRASMDTCGTGQCLLAGVSGGLDRGSPIFAPPTDKPV